MKEKKTKKLNEGLFGSAKKFTDSFFDGLKTNTVNNALKKAKQNKKIPAPIIQKMTALDKLAKELEDDLKYYMD
jgi:hypothetical protein